jgi:hypothetical protein
MMVCLTLINVSSHFLFAVSKSTTHTRASGMHCACSLRERSCACSGQGRT